MTTRIHLALHQDAATPPSPATGYVAGDPFVTSDGVVHILQSDGATWQAASGGGGGGPNHADVQIIVPGVLAVGTNIVPPGLFIGRASTITALYLALGTAPSGGACELTLNYTSGGAPAAMMVTVASGATTGHSDYSGGPLAVDAGTYITIDVTTANGAADANIALLATAS